ncbi:hypothetical protein ACS0TY_020435 [Phlomoides rotata]
MFTCTILFQIELCFQITIVQHGSGSPPVQEESPWIYTHLPPALLYKRGFLSSSTHVAAGDVICIEANSEQLEGWEGEMFLLLRLIWRKERDLFGIRKEAEQVAAEIACSALSVAQGDGSYKLLLQDMTLKKGHHPLYTKDITGPGHLPVFVSSVVVRPYTFTRVKAKTKKQALMSVTKVAYFELKKREEAGGDEEEEE